MRREITALLGIGLALAAFPATAQPDDTQEAPITLAENGIVVTGDRVPDKAVNQFIYDMLRPQAIGQEGQYPRLIDPFCPSVIGFADEAETAIEARMRQVAAAAGIPTADKEKCQPNMHLVRVENGQETIRTLREKRSRAAFGSIPLHVCDTIERREGPIFSWQQVLSYGSDTRAIIQGNPINGGPLDPAALALNFIYDNPRLRTPAQAAFRHSIVLVEREALEEVSVTQLADFAVMRGLLPAREDQFREGARSADSILGLFDPAVDKDARLPSLGRLDLALLTSLYAAPVNVNANRQRGRMVKTFRAVLEKLE